MENRYKITTVTYENKQINCIDTKYISWVCLRYHSYTFMTDKVNGNSKLHLVVSAVFPW